MLAKNEESAWQKASASLDATAKIYGFRVDSVHSETFKFLGGLNRNKKDSKNENNGENQEEISQTKKKEKIKKGLHTLETNINKLNLTKYDIDTEVDPLFSVMTSKFNESSARGLLLNTIPLDLNLNYILECKREDEITFPKKEKLKIAKKDDDTNVDSDCLSKGLSEPSGNKQIKDAFSLYKNLKRNEDNDDSNEKNVYPVMCAHDFENTKIGIKNALKSFIKNNNVDDFIKLQICPELSIFRESRKINTEESNTSFINTFKEEIDYADKEIPNTGLDDNNSVINEEEQNNFGETEGEGGIEDLPEGASQNSNTDFNSVHNNDGNQNDEGSDPNISNFNLKNNENSFTVFRYEDLIERAGHFGSGNTQDLPEFMNFAINFGKLNKNTFFNKGAILGLKNKKDGAKKKKEEKTFIFNEQNEANINDLFSEVRSKLLIRPNDNMNDFEKRKKIKCFFHFDKLSQFRLYTITGKTIMAQDIENDLDIKQQENNLVEGNNDDDNFGGGDNNDDNQNDNDIVGFEKNNDLDTFYQNEKKAEKNFGKLYRKFDIRSLKKKIWISFEELKDKKIDFKNILVNMSKNMNEDEIFSISTPTCFVCMLHLCNEKTLFIEQKDMNTFYISKDHNMAKSSQSTEAKRKNNDNTDSEDLDMEK